MITYNPPKSQIWGHQVGRQTAVMIVERGERFLIECCRHVASTPSELMVAWVPTTSPSVSEAVAAIEGQLGAAKKAIDMPDAAGVTHRQLRFSVSAAQLLAVASWFDRMRDAMARGDVVANCSTFWTFVWQEEVAADSMSTCGGTFAVHLSRPHRLTTRFTFRDAAHYHAIKAYLATIELVLLSDKHVRPKGSMPVVERATR